MQSAPDGQDQDARGDHANANPVPERRAFAQEEDGKHRNEHEAELAQRQNISKLYAEHNGKEWRDDDGNRGTGAYSIPGVAKKVKTFTIGKLDSKRSGMTNQEWAEYKAGERWKGQLPVIRSSVG